MNARRVVEYSGSSNPFFGKKHSEATMEKFRARTHPHVKEDWFKQLRSEQMKGDGNPTKGTSVYEIWVKKYGEDRASELMDASREKTSRNSSGENNPMFDKPAPKGSGNGWSGWYKGWYFRSLRELAYMIRVIEAQGLRWETAESSNLRIPYLDWSGTPRTYTADFLIEGRILVEIKPEKLKASKTVALKRAAAVEFCLESGLEYHLIDPGPMTDDEITRLHDSGLIRFLDRYEAKYQERFKV